MEKEEKEQHFDEALVSGLIGEWLATRDEKTFAAILAASANLIRVQLYLAGLPVNDEDAWSRVHLKLWKALPRFDPAKGRAFTFLNITIKRELLSYKTPRLEKNYVDRSLDGERLDDILENSSGDAPEPGDRERLKEIAGAIRRMKTPRYRLRDRAIQRWIVRVLLETDFRPKRFEVAEAARKVHRLSPARARRLYDLTVLSLRRELLGERTASGTLNDGQRLLFLTHGLSSKFIREFSSEEILYGFARELPLFGYWSSHGRRASPETRAKQRAAKIGRKVSRETRRRMSAGLRGRLRGALSAEHRAAISEAKKGRKLSAEHCARMSAALKGRPQGKRSPETRARISAAKRGCVISAETRAKLSAALKGRPQAKRSAETRARISAAKRGTVTSPETRAKLSAATKAYYERLRTGRRSSQN